jgi:hypothetical protein
MQEPERPRMSPAWIAALLVAFAVIGAGGVWLLANATHKADQLAVQDYHSATEPWLNIAREAETSLSAGSSYDRERLEEAHAAILVLQSPTIMRPLQERDLAWLTELVEANQLLHEQGMTGSFKDALAEAIAAREEADLERDEIECAAIPETCST